jgi:hypothetical protein
MVRMKVTKPVKGMAGQCVHTGTTQSGSVHVLRFQYLLGTLYCSFVYIVKKIKYVLSHGIIMKIYFYLF